MWEWDSNITYGNVIPILYMGMSFQLQIPISYMGILFPHEIGEWPTIINVAPEGAIERFNFRQSPVTRQGKKEQKCIKRPLI